MAVSERDAREAALRHLKNATWEPAITNVEDAGDSFFYNSRAYAETGAFSHALAGNLPLLISKDTGEVQSDLTFLAPGHPARPGLPTTTVSKRLRNRIERDFPSDESAEEITRIVAEASDTERVQAAIVLTARGDLGRLRSAIDLAKQDWRDVLVGAGLEGSDWQHRLFSEFGPAE